jgi:hypothetical protein
MVGSVCHVKHFILGLRNSLKDIQKLQMMPGHLQMWLRQQSKEFYAVGFETMVKKWEKCINVDGRYVRK